MQLNTGRPRNLDIRSSLFYSLSRTGSVLALLNILAALLSPLRADSGLLTLSQDVASNGGRVVLNLNFNSAATPQVQSVGLQWALAFNAKSVANISVAPGAGAIAAGKSIACYQASGTYSCLASGLNSNSMQSGTVARMTVTFATAYQGLVSFGVTNTRGVTAVGTAVPIGGQGAAVVVSGVTSLACSPTAVPSASSTNCTVTISPAAPVGGATVFLASNSRMLVVPTAVIVPAGATTAIFSVHTGSISTKRNATITASYSGTVQRTTLTLGSSRSHPRMLSCNQPVLTAGNGTACTVALSGEDEGGEFTISSSQNLKAPLVIATRPGQRTARFQVSASAFSPRQTANITVHDGNSSVSQAIEVLPSSAPVLILPERRFARIGESVEFKVAAADPSGSPSMLMAVDLPKGATFDASSGRFAWTPDASQAGQFDITFTAVSSAAASAAGHTLLDVGSGKPLIRGVRNAASQALTGCSAGSPATLTGSWLSAGQATASDPSGGSMELAGARVIVNGKAASVLAVSPERIDFLCPEAQPGTRLSISVENEAGSAPAVETVTQPPKPGIVARDHSGSGQGMVTFSGTSQLAASRTYEAVGQPAQAGDLLTIMATGIDPSAAPPLVRIGGVVVSARSAGAIPGQAGVFGVEILVPPGIPEGDAIPLSILPSSQAASASNTVTIAIE